MGKFGILFGILILIALLVGMGGCSSYSSIVKLDEQAKGQWAQIDTQLQRRYDLIPNIVATVKGYASHEKEVLENIANARTKYFAAPDDSAKAKAAGDVERALSRLLVLTETYPQLKANEGFLKLQDQLEGTENRISVERGRYNEVVKELNAYLRSPTGLLGNLFARVKPRDYFEVASDARSAPRVDFSGEAKVP